MTNSDSKERERNKTRTRAARIHQGSGHWHVESRSNILVCRSCRAKIPKWKNPEYCPDCGEGRSKYER